MYNIKLYDYVPEPNPVTSNYIVCAHYYAAWKKGAAGLHNGFNDLHEYPERTPLMGYYDEENPAVCDWEIKWAAEHGINCFIHCWYRKRENARLPVTHDALRCGHGLHEAMFNAKYQKYMNFAIMYEASSRWCGTDENDIVQNLMPFWFENYFSRDNYLKIDGKPVLFVYDCANQVKSAFPNPDDQKKAFDKCRDFMVQKGYPGLIIALTNSGARSTCPQERDEAYARGYDFRFVYNYYFTGPGCFPPEELIIQDQKKKFTETLAADPMGQILTASCFWDPRPRTTKAWLDLGYHFSTAHLWHISPEAFRKVIRNCREMAQALPDGAWGKRLIMIDNWNEWDEGHFVAPSHAYGFKYLQAIREELTQRDNLPDYRTPQDICPLDYNKTWDVPDFSGVKCKEDNFL